MTTIPYLGSGSIPGGRVGVEFSPKKNDLQGQEYYVNIRVEVYTIS
jgi:hypothetical protein